MDEHCYNHIEVVCTPHSQILYHDHQLSQYMYNVYNREEKWGVWLYWCTYTALSQFVQHIEDRVQLLEYSPASCLAPQNHCEEKRQKFITRRINNKLPSHFSFDTCRHSLKFFKSQWEHIFSFGWMKNSFSRGNTSFVWKKHYSKSSSRNSQLACITGNRDLAGF